MLLNRIELENLLSFKHVSLELRPLNVLIGANASGKSNLIRALGLVQSLGRDFGAAISSGGGPTAWINQRRKASTALMLLEFPPHQSLDGEPQRVEYLLSFRQVRDSYEIVREAYTGIFEREGESFATNLVNKKASIARQKPVISEVRHPSEPEIGSLADRFKSIRLYQEFKTGPRAQARDGISASAFGAYLTEDGSNLALVLNEFQEHGGLQRVNEVLKQFFDLSSEVFSLTRGGLVQTYLREKGMSNPIAATSLSDGTLRLLCLLCVLLDPDPPPLICLEEPETGLHPDAIRMVGELLVEASARTQLVVTTHSPELIDSLTGEAESVVVCERDFDGFTSLRRLSNRDLNAWLERYSLGTLWQKGEIGGNRW